MHHWRSADRSVSSAMDETISVVEEWKLFISHILMVRRRSARSTRSIGHHLCVENRNVIRNREVALIKCHSVLLSDSSAQAILLYILAVKNNPDFFLWT